MKKDYFVYSIGPIVLIEDIHVLKKTHSFISWINTEQMLKLIFVYLYHVL